jgi:hypothetical protein
MTPLTDALVAEACHGRPIEDVVTEASRHRTAAESGSGTPPSRLSQRHVHLELAVTKHRGPGDGGGASLAPHLARAIVFNVPGHA